VGGCEATPQQTHSSRSTATAHLEGKLQGCNARVAQSIKCVSLISDVVGHLQTKRHKQTHRKTCCHTDQPHGALQPNLMLHSLYSPAEAVDTVECVHEADWLAYRKGLLQRLTLFRSTRLLFTIFTAYVQPSPLYLPRTTVLKLPSPRRCMISKSDTEICNLGQSTACMRPTEKLTEARARAHEHNRTTHSYQPRSASLQLGFAMAC